MLNIEQLADHLLLPPVNKQLCLLTGWQVGLPYQIQPLLGLSAGSYLIKQNDNAWIARQQTSFLRQLGADRRREYQILKKWKDKQWAPTPFFYYRGWLLIEYLTGETLTQSQWLQSIEQGLLANKLYELHRQPRYGYYFSIKHLIEQHWQNSDTKRRTSRQLRYHRHLMHQKVPTALQIAPLHLDLHKGNIIIKQQSWYFIDWEYAADGDIALELAFLYRSSEWTESVWQQFLADYAAHWRLNPRIVLQKQKAWQPWVDYLILLWYEVRWQQTSQSSYATFAENWRKRLSL